jgi:hypothetical protein
LRPFSQKLPFDRREVLIQGDSVRLAWAKEEPATAAERLPLRREAPGRTSAPEIGRTSNVLQLRLGEELEYARRLLDITGDELSGDPIAVSRHGVALQSLDIVGQMLGHIANVVRSNDQPAAVDAIGMCDLKARLTRSRPL